MAKPDPADLQIVPLFEGLSGEEYRVLADWMEVDEHERGDRLVRDHAHGYAFYILASGLAHAELEDKVLEDLKPGDVFGEMAFFYSNSRRTATVVADTPVRLFVMFGTHFREMEATMPAVAARLRRLVEDRSQREAEAGADKTV
ncbi:MAG TPA: cyclic nucleotide-binding domain-containing protein [Acidimicrobiales bacterium]|jgi:CRP-like cAMP-binding protein|nr:cyclic nucleotide-binding domain-containing protein [Acidimicrobiales bacterium]